ncbi:MAG: hypothetical protein EXR85_04150 [Xanthomonadales bacterium]|nr:hypothetical protein [Xanthomonadales bacterium]
MKKQIVSSMAVLLLSGCVYYVPYEVAATEPWVDEPVAYEEPAVAYESYVVSPYYPWASLDYFYFGNNYYRPYSGFSFSFGFYAGGGWYPPYYSPYYYSAWYQPFYGFPYPYYYPYPYAYYGGGYNHWDHHHGDDHDDYHGGGHDGGYGGHGGGHPGNGPGDSYYGKGVDRSIRKGGYPSLDRHVDVQREPGQFNRNVSAKPSASAAAHGTAVGNRGDNKIKPSLPQPSHEQPRGVPPLGNKAYDGSSKPVDLSGFAGQNGQVRTIQPQQNNAAPPRTGMPGGLSRPAPAQGSNGKQYSVRQATPAQPAPVQQSAPQPSFNQQNAPQPKRAAPTGDYSGRPEGGYDRGSREGGDNDGGFHHRDRDDR